MLKHPAPDAYPLCVLLYDAILHRLMVVKLPAEHRLIERLQPLGVFAPDLEVNHRRRIPFGRHLAIPPLRQRVQPDEIARRVVERRDSPHALADFHRRHARLAARPRDAVQRRLQVVHLHIESDKVADGHILPRGKDAPAYAPLIRVHQPIRLAAGPLSLEYLPAEQLAVILLQRRPVGPRYLKVNNRISHSLFPPESFLRSFLSLANNNRTQRCSCQANFGRILRNV